MKNIETSQRERVRSFPDLCVFFPSTVTLLASTSCHREGICWLCVFEFVVCVFFLVLICRDVLGLNVLDVNNSTD